MVWDSTGMFYTIEFHNQENFKSDLEQYRYPNSFSLHDQCVMQYSGFQGYYVTPQPEALSVLLYKF